MNGKSIKKVPNGKLVKVSVSFSDLIESIQISGDFFLYPESCIASIEQRLSGIPSNPKIEEVQEIIDQVLREQNAEFLGLTAKDLAEAVVEALNSGKAKGDF